MIFICKVISNTSKMDIYLKKKPYDIKKNIEIQKLSPIMKKWWFSSDF